MAEIEQPIIIKKITIDGGGAHGGAWKVAYADFVTAMMAFFLLLWLLSSVPQDTKSGLAEFFTPTVGIKDSKGIGFQGGASPTDSGTRKSELTPVGIISGSPMTGQASQDPSKPAPVDAKEEGELFVSGAKDIKKAMEDDPSMRALRDNIVVEQSPEGLKIEITDSDKFQMFFPGKEDLSEYGRRVLKKMLPIIERMPNHISITGHTDASPFSGGAQYGNWELSTGRATAARRYLLSEGMYPERVGKVVGRASQELLIENDPKNPRNRRLTVILLRGSYVTTPIEQDAAPRELLKTPRAKLPKTKEAEKPVEKINEKTILKDAQKDKTLKDVPAVEEKKGSMLSAPNIKGLTAEEKPASASKK